MLKWIGLLLLASTAVAAGLYCTNRLRGRVEQLEASRLWILDVENEIRYASTPICSMLQDMAARDTYKSLWFLPTLAEACREKGGAPRPASALLRDIFSMPHTLFSPDRMTKDDRVILLSFTEQLGCSDQAGQIQHCSLCAARLEQQLAAARLAYKDKGRLYSLLGIFAGLALLLFFL